MLQGSIMILWQIKIIIIKAIWVTVSIIFIDVPVIGNFSIQPAVGLSMKGITYEYDKFTTKKVASARFGFL